MADVHYMSYDIGRRHLVYNNVIQYMFKISFIKMSFTSEVPTEYFSLCCTLEELCKGQTPTSDKFNGHVNYDPSVYTLNTFSFHSKPFFFKRNCEECLVLCYIF